MFKSSILWSATIACSVVGSVVGAFGGWTNVFGSVHAIKLVKTVWVTNEVQRAGEGHGHSVWEEPLKPITPPEPEGMFKQWEGHRIPNPDYFHATNMLVFSNVLYSLPMQSTNMFVTNLYFYNNYITNGR